MPRESGGAAPRRGFSYQDVAAAYFFVTDRPDFISQRPLELHIEQFDSDFTFFIRHDEFDEEHYFEVKYRESGDISLADYYSLLSDFSDIQREYADSDNASYYHLVTNASFGYKLNALFDDAKDLRRNIHAWSRIKDKTLYQQRSVNQLEENTELEDASLATLVRGLYGHRKSKEHMVEALFEFVRQCNSPGRFREPAHLILHEINEKDSGVVRRKELESVSDSSLEKQSDSTESSATRSTDELIGDLRGMAEEFSNPSVETARLQKGRETTISLTERMLNRDDLSDRVVESQASGLEEDISSLIDIKEEEERLKYGVSQKAERFLNLIESDSADNKSGGDQEI